MNLMINEVVTFLPFFVKVIFYFISLIGNRFLRVVMIFFINSDKLKSLAINFIIEYAFGLSNFVS